MRRASGFFAALIAAVCAAGIALAQPPRMAVVSPEVSAGHTITFRLLAPNAKQVSVNGEFTHKAIAMVRDEKGVWSVTTEPVRPDVYGYAFNMDGLTMPDPCNTFVRVGSLAYESQVEVPGDEAAFESMRNVPHGAIHEHLYHSKELNTERRVLVYTPPGYDGRAGRTYPVLYLLHGMGDDEGFWLQVGRANLIMDNLLAASKAKPAIIVMPFGHTSRNISMGRGGAGGAMFDVPVIGNDLKENVIPLVEKEYRVNIVRGSRAIAGLSMGGYQSLAIGLNNLPLFAYVAGFSSALVGAPFESVVPGFLADPAKANKQLRLFWLGVGGDDGLMAANQKFEQTLTAKGITHEWTVTPGYAHWWTLWRVYLNTLLPRLFN